MNPTLVNAPPAPIGAMALETYQLTKRFGQFTALDEVTINVKRGSVHALLGENGAGKSTLVKCIAGFHCAQSGSILCDGREQSIANPSVARRLGIGMVYQHFTQAPGMSVAENLLLAGGQLPARIKWRHERKKLAQFIERTPFKLDLDALPSQLAAGEKQKLELLKQLYLQPRLLILDEPTSVLTPQEADEVLGHVRELAGRGVCTVLLITHKFREVLAYADDVTVLRRGRVVHHSAVVSTDSRRLADSMIGELAAADSEANSAGNRAAKTSVTSRENQTAESANDRVVLHLDALCANGDRGTRALDALSLQVRTGEILGIAGVSGNGQRELVEVLVGQRARLSGRVTVMGQTYSGRREENRRLKLRSLPEEPLRNACVASMSVAENMALRDFEQAPLASAGLLKFSGWRERARHWIADYGIKTRGENAPIGSLSGGNVQRAVLARELAGQVNILIAANPVFGLDFAAVREIHRRLRQVREAGGAVLLVSEDLDELLELADRIVVMSEGRIVYEVLAQNAERRVLGAHMGGGHREALAAQ